LRRLNDSLAAFWAGVGPRLLPFADAADEDLPLSRLLRLSLFQITVGMAAVLLMGTLNRVMIVELGVPAWLVALMLSLPLFFAPLRALIGFRSDVYRSYLGWRRVPFIWIGTLLQFGGLAILPFALIVLSGDTHGPVLYGQLAAFLALLLVGAGMHTTQTVGLALATDLARESQRPRVVALLFVMLLVGMFVSALLFGWLLRDFSQLRLIQVIQGAAALTMILNICALWKQEARDPERTLGAVDRNFARAWRALRQDGRVMRLLVAVGMGTAGFAMQDVLLEPFGGQVLGLSVGATTGLTALLAGGMLAAFAVAARRLGRGAEPHRIAAYGALVGVFAFAVVTVTGAFASVTAFAAGVALIGFGGGLFGVGTVTAAMNLARDGNSGLALGAWGAVQATASGVAVAAGGAIRDLVNGLAENGSLGVALTGNATGYGAVYLIEVVLLFATLVAIGPLAGFVGEARPEGESGFGLAEFPG
jgi:BCD family chlorophyll transporter-like MFS transporter